MLVGSSHIAGGSGAGAVKAGATVIVVIIRANRVASILRDLFIFYSPFSFLLQSHAPWYAYCFRHGQRACGLLISSLQECCRLFCNEVLFIACGRMFYVAAPFGRLKLGEFHLLMRIESAVVTPTHCTQSSLMLLRSKKSRGPIRAFVGFLLSMFMLFFCVLWTVPFKSLVTENSF